MKKKCSLLNLAAMVYLYLPILVFMLLWVKLPIAIVASACVLVSIYLFCKVEEPEAKKRVTAGFVVLVLLCFLFFLAWALVSGLGGYFNQTGDWPKHNTILNDMIKMQWPVRFSFHTDEFSGDGVLCYYIAGYILPALVGKVAGFHAAEITELLFAAVGLLIGCLLFHRNYGEKKNYTILIVAATMFLFATFLCPILGIYREWYSWDAALGGMWLSDSVMIQYSSNISMLRWVFPQMQGTIVATALFLENRKKPQTWLLIAFPLVLHSTFTFLGLGVVMALTYLQEWFQTKEKLAYVKNTFSKVNLLALLTGLVLLVYIISNFMQQKPENAKMGLEIINYLQEGRMIFILVAFQATWGLWALLLFKEEKKNPVFWASCVILFILPFFSLGQFNDLCMRTSIPALLTFCALVAKNIIHYLKKDRFYAGVLIVCLILAGLGSMEELHLALQNSDLGQINRREPYENSEEYYLSSSYIMYQYIAWGDSALNWLLQK